jgi:hypothetical protein
MGERSGSEMISGWPDDSREAAQIVIETYGEPPEVTQTQLTWHNVGAWKRVVATKAFYAHNFPAPHIDCVETFIDYRVPPESFTDLANFDGSVMIDRTAGEISARCHYEQANNLALNLAHDIVTGQKTAAAAREYYAEEFANARRKRPTPYMDKLHFAQGSNTADPDERILSDEDLQQAQQEGEREG